MSGLRNPPTLIEHGNLRFLVLDAPSNTNLQSYIELLQKHNVRHLVRVCQETYDSATVENAGISVHHWPFQDGEAPSEQILTDWLNLVKNELINGSDDAAIAVHCVAGLGRAPVLVAVALIKFANMKNLDAVEMIRQKRRGAINAKQLQFLKSYKSNKNCIVM